MYRLYDIDMVFVEYNYMSCLLILFNILDSRVILDIDSKIVETILVLLSPPSGSRHPPQHIEPTKQKKCQRVSSNN